MGGRDPRKLQRGGEPGSKGEGEGGGAEETLLQHGVSSRRGGCKHGTRAPFQGSPLKGQRLRCDLDSAAAFITSGAGAARLAGRRARRCSRRSQGDVASLPAVSLRGASAVAWQDLHPAQRFRPPSVEGQSLPHPLGAPTPGSARGPLGSTSAHSEDPGQVSSQFSHLGNGDNAIWSIKRAFSPMVTGATSPCVVSERWLFALSNICVDPHNYAIDQNHPPQSQDQVTCICRP